MRSRIDITEIEAQTKIRAKYLRALENEEWDLLPGPTYVKTLPAHLRGRAGPRRAHAGRGVQAAPRAPLRRRPAADLPPPGGRQGPQAGQALPAPGNGRRGARRARRRAVCARPRGGRRRARRQRHPGAHADEHVGPGDGDDDDPRRAVAGAAARHGDRAGRGVRAGGGRAPRRQRRTLAGRPVHRHVSLATVPVAALQRPGGAARERPRRARSRRTRASSATRSAARGRSRASGRRSDPRARHESRSRAQA